jgi:UDP:flavonoid glycosyltransferase YjiC (YdhE family)
VIVEQYVPQADVLPFCDAAVSHGGAGSTLAALAHGLPILLLPQGADQFDNAASAAASGAAAVLKPEAVTATAVTAAVRSPLDEPPYSAAAKSVALDIASMPSPEVVVAALTDFASATRPPS